MTLPYFLKDFAPSFPYGPALPGRTPCGTRVLPSLHRRIGVRRHLLEDLGDALPDQRLPRLGVESDRKRRAVHPVNLDPVWGLALHHQQAIVQCGVMTRAQERHIPY